MFSCFDYGTSAFLLNCFHPNYVMSNWAPCGFLKVLVSPILTRRSNASWHFCVFCVIITTFFSLFVLLARSFLLISSRNHVVLNDNFIFNLNVEVGKSHWKKRYKFTSVVALRLLLILLFPTLQIVQHAVHKSRASVSNILVLKHPKFSP